MPEPVKQSPLVAAAPSGIAARARAASAPPYLAGLNPEQREAVETLDGPVLVLAGAGTGKTRVLTTRIAHILSLGRARPSEILAVTFTNKAAREMKQRIGHMVGAAVEGMPWLGTFHSIGVKILRRHAELADLSSNFTILDTDDQIRLMKQVLEAENIDEKRWPARHLAGLIDGWKNRGLLPEQVKPGEGSAFADGRGVKLYAAYQARLKSLNATDFGDLLLENIRLFQRNPGVLQQYQHRFRFILVDEYQDTNVAQYLWLRLLGQSLSSPPPTEARVSRPEQDDDAFSLEATFDAEPHHAAPALRPDPPFGGEGDGGAARQPRNICCVGDDDQSIYGWRGAEVDNILRFEKDFPGARVIRLERNYRSTGHILAAASHLIAHNQGRLGKTLRAVGDAGEKVTVTSAWDSEEEARIIGEEIEQLQRKGHSLDEIAILVRASFQTREFEDRFVTLGLPYRLIGGVRFYERAEIRDALAYLRCVNSESDDLAFERIVNVPKRGIGDATVKLLYDHGRAADLSLMASARALAATDELKTKVRQALRELIAAFDRWRAQAQTVTHTELTEIVLDESGYTGMWQKDRSADAAGRLENLKELVRSMEEFENLQGFLEHISLVMDADRDVGAEAVSMMTLHAAKGLEFDTVFLPGWEEGLLPHQRSLDEVGRAGLEEERRLAHVGLTRARRRAKIYFVSHRKVRGSWTSTVPSRFIDELPEAHVEVTESQTAFGGFAGHGNVGGSRFDEMQAFGSTYSTPGWQRAKGRGFESRGFAGVGPGGGSGGRGSPGGGAPWQGGAGAQGRGRSGPMTIEGELVTKSTGVASAYKVGDRVFHQKFGNGNVVQVEGNKLTIAFDRAGEKKIVDSFVARV